MKKVMRRLSIAAVLLLLLCARGGLAQEAVEKAKVLKTVTGAEKAASGKEEAPAGKAAGGRAGGVAGSAPEEKVDTVDKKKPEEKIKKVPGVGAARAVAARKVAAPVAPVPAAEEVFVLPDLGWRDVFTDPREAVRDMVDGSVTGLDLAQETKKVWEDGIAALTIEQIIGIEDNLTAVIAGKKVKAGYTVTAEKLKFRIEKIAGDAVHFICVSKEKEYEELRDLKVRRRIGF